MNDESVKLAVESAKLAQEPAMWNWMTQWATFIIGFVLGVFVTFLLEKLFFEDAANRIQRYFISS